MLEHAVYTYAALHQTAGIAFDQNALTPDKDAPAQTLDYERVGRVDKKFSG